MAAAQKYRTTMSWAQLIGAVNADMTALYAGAATLPSQAAGFGTPTGAAVIANFPGASATLLQTSQTVAQLLIALKAAGIISA